MKPNKIQIEVAREIQSQASFWSTTNDITSLTHYCDIAESLNLIDNLTEEQIEKLEDKIADLFDYIKSLK